VDRVATLGSNLERAAHVSQTGPPRRGRAAQGPL
jgi:hypothetical protein